MVLGTLRTWQVLVASEETAAAQMALDEELARRGRAVFRLFRWMSPAISLGLKQPAPEWVDAALLAAHRVELVERPTGGGLAVHGSDVSCSVVVPCEFGQRIRHLVEAVCESLANGVRALGAPVRWVSDGERSARIEHCLTEESPYAIMVGERKLGGLAVRRYQASWLIQGSLLIRALPEVFRRLMPQPIYEAFQTRAIPLEEAAGKRVPEVEVIARLIRAWRRNFA